MALVWGKTFLMCRDQGFCYRHFGQDHSLLRTGAVLCTVGYLVTSLAFTHWDQDVYYRHFGLEHSLLLGVCGGGRLSWAL